ncbi:serine/threonine protein kinase [Actinoplanes solisilvae]|uniref:serine/threonine protein kinase n=1 Tax=Actinoplanes solisilvae TaxID=2486853 RepID=UPI000FDB419B|nr:serine/threonine-protein kinase [Actinoplanes solisilvae]
MSHQTGETLDSRYRLGERIASGGMGDVWHGTDLLLNRAVAVKTLRDDRAADPQFHRRFEHEARAMAALHHPGIADVYDFSHEPTNAYLVMAYVHGQPLDRRIAARGRLPVGETMSIVAQVARALQAAHDIGIEHRDVKPGNIIVQPNGTAVLVDFGIAHCIGSAELTSTKDLLGTPHYLAPERLSKRGAGPAADVYALGAVAYHCLAGQPPFMDEDPLTIAFQHLREEPPPLPAEVPAAVCAVVTTALAKKPADRFPSAAAMAEAAARVAAVNWREATTESLSRPRLRRGFIRQPEHTTAGGRSRRSTALAPALAVLAVVTGSAALAVAAPFGHDPGSPRPSVSAPAPPAAVAPSNTSATPAAGNGAGETKTHRPSRPVTRAPSTTINSPRPTPAKTSTMTTHTSKPPTSRPPTVQPSTAQPSTNQPTTTQPPTSAPETDPSAAHRS